MNTFGKILSFIGKIFRNNGHLRCAIYCAQSAILVATPELTTLFVWLMAHRHQVEAVPWTPVNLTIAILRASIFGLSLTAAVLNTIRAFLDTSASKFAKSPETPSVTPAAPAQPQATTTP